MLRMGTSQLVINCFLNHKFKSLIKTYLIIYQIYLPSGLGWGHYKNALSHEVCMTKLKNDFLEVHATTND